MEIFDYEYRVRYADTDKLGISYYANYFVWFEAARTEYFRALGLPYTECEKKGYFLPVAETSARYLAPSPYDDLLVIRTSVSDLKKSSMRFEYEVRNKQTNILLATGFSTHVFVDRSLRPAGIPDEVKRIVRCFSLLTQKETSKN